jgi:hypothetical protein
MGYRRYERRSSTAAAEVDNVIREDKGVLVSGHADCLMKAARAAVVPVERIELPTFGLQNRCSTAELNRLVATD